MTGALLESSLLEIRPTYLQQQSHQLVYVILRLVSESRRAQFVCFNNSVC